MDLFVVNRYTDENIQDDNAKEQECSNLKRVLKKIKKRKKQEAETTLNNTQDNEIKSEEIIEEDLNCDEPEVKKSKTLEQPSVVDVSSKEPGDFMVLDLKHFDERQQHVKRVLPKWLRKPTVVSVNLQNLDVKVKHVPELDSNVRKSLKSENIKYLFPIQSTFIPWQLETSRCSDCIVPCDGCVSAPTGSGKTLTYIVPLVQWLKRQLEQRQIVQRMVRVLVVLPTRSLATQIYNTFKYYCTNTDLNVILVTGEQSLIEEQKQLILHNSVWGPLSLVDIIISTPGRLVDHIKFTEGFDLTHLNYLVIDEADRVLDNVQDDWLHHLDVHLSAYGHNRNKLNLLTVKEDTSFQKLLFSATLSQDAEMLQKLSLFQPKLFTCTVKNNNESESKDTFVGKYTTPDELIEKYVISEMDMKPMILCKLFIDNMSTGSRILVFTNSIDSVHRLKLLLEYMLDGRYTVAEISSNQSDFKAQQSLMKLFTDGKINVLICTDVMARGIDFPNVDCVISYNVPSYLKTYIHRAGRTARAGSIGTCISIVQRREINKFLSMLNVANKHPIQIEMDENELEQFVERYEKSLTYLKEYVSNETTHNLQRVKQTKRRMRTQIKNKKRNKFIA